MARLNAPLSPRAPSSRALRAGPTRKLLEAAATQPSDPSSDEEPERRPRKLRDKMWMGMDESGDSDKEN